MQLRLQSARLPEGEISLDEISKIAELTQRFIRRLARGLTDTRGPGPAPSRIIEGTRLFLVGVRRGSTILEVAGPVHGTTMFSESDPVPEDLDEITINLALEALGRLNDEAPEMPTGIDARAAADIDEWLRGLRSYDSVQIGAALPTRGTEDVTVVPRQARQRLKSATVAPVVPYVTMNQQALDGHLYAVNLRSGLFRIEDATGRSIGIDVPRSLHSRAVLLVDTDVRVIGRPSLDDRYRLMSFEATDISSRQRTSEFEQTGFFETHDLALPPAVSADEIDSWGVSDLADDEAERFLATLREQ